MIVLDAKIKILKKKVIFAYNGKNFLELNREVFSSLLGTSSENTEEDDLHINALIKTYESYRDKYYGRNTVKSITKKDSDYKFFREAYALVKRHGVDYATYIKAQIRGLAFAQTFPKPNQLVTVKAEERLLDYLKNEQVEIDSENKEQDKDRYKKLSRKIQLGKASMKEVKFVAKYEAKHLGGVSSRTKAYLVFLKSKGL